MSENQIEELERIISQKVQNRMPGETYKSQARRLRQGWFEKYAPIHLSGIDIGCQMDPLTPTFRRWDFIFGDTDATYMEGVPDNVFHTTYLSHVLEHLEDPITGVKNWYRITKPLGHIIILVPHRDLYEKKAQPPSMWNFDHKWFYLPESEEPPRTLNLKKVIQAAIPNANIVSYNVLDSGYDYNLPANVHAVGEYSIEAIIKKEQI